MPRKTEEAKQRAGVAGQTRMHDALSSSREEGSPFGIEECPEGYLTPMDMVMYIRARADGLETPPDIEEHVDSCTPCGRTWQFLQATDPVFRKFRTERVKALMRRMEKDPVLANSLHAPQENHQENEKLAMENEDVMIEMIADKYEEDLQAEIKPRQGSEEQSGVSREWLCGRCRNIQHTDVRYRYPLANAFSRALNRHFFANMDKKPRTEEILHSIVWAPSTTFDLTKLTGHPADLPPGLPSVVELAVAYFMKFPWVNYYPPGSILKESEGGSIVLDRVAFDRYRKEFEKLTESNSAPPMHLRF